MKNVSPSNANRFLKLNYSEKDKIWLSDQNTLRKLVGILGMLLPVLLFIFLLIDTSYSSPLESISHYYFTRACSVFVIIVSLLAIFLLVYKGEEPIDFYISSVAGIFALCLLLFPTNNISNICCDLSKKYSVTILKISEFRKTFHYISAGIFLSCLAFMSIFLFTKSDKPIGKRTKKKKLRNKLYRTFGIIMLFAILVIFAGYLKLIHDEFYTTHHLTFWMETLAVESFGISWLIKGEFYFKD